MFLTLTDDVVDDDTTVDKVDAVVVSTKLAISSADNLNGQGSFGDIIPIIYMCITTAAELHCRAVCAVPEQQSRYLPR